MREEEGEGMIIKSQNKDLVVDTNGNGFHMFCESEGRYAIETREGILGIYKTKKKAEKILDEIAEQIGCCRADEIIYAGRGIGGLRVTVYQALAQEYVYQMPEEEEEDDAD